MLNYGQPIGGGTYGLSALLGLSADEFVLYPSIDPVLDLTYTNSLLSNTNNYSWNGLYNCIFQSNSAIEGISASSTVTAPIKQQLLGEAEFIRALCTFYLVNIYGDVPIVTTSNYRVNEAISRSPEPQVYKQIIADLLNAQKQLSNNYLTPDGSVTSNRVRPNREAATALLARVYLYEQKWDSAEVEANEVIANTKYGLESDLNSVFLTNSSEAIWQLELPNNGNNTPDASAFLLSYYSGPNSYNAPFILSDSLVYNFEPGDLRLTHWVDSIVVASTVYYFPFKYKVNYTGLAPQEYPMVLRLAEQYLIRAEARAQQNNLVGSAADLNMIRLRAGLPNSKATTQSDLLKAIYNERRFELFTEYGNRWLDLKRIGNIDAVMSKVTPQKGGVWKPTEQLYPIPLSDIQADPNLKQNPGYN